MDVRQSYQVNLEFFQGPLDLLLFLIKKQKIDIHDIPIATITREYLDYLNQKEKINLDREAEFVLMAALLIYIKSQMLLPQERPEPEEDSRQMLVDRLLDFQKIKALSYLLKEKEGEELKKWKRTYTPSHPSEEELELEDISLFDLAEAFFLLMKRKEKENIRIIKGKDFTVEEKMKEIISILEEKGYLDFFEYFYDHTTLQESLVAFFALLELIKARIVLAAQETLFQSIKVWLRKKPRTSFSG